MLIRCWGSRGSISVSGKEYIKYGGDTTCIEVVGSSGDIIILDAGTGIRRLGNKLMNEKPAEINIFFTHSHWDHLAGFPFFKPLYHGHSHIHIRGPRTTQDSIMKIVSHTMTPPYFPMELEDIHADIEFLSTTQDTIEIGSMKVKTIPLSHTNRGVGYSIEEDGKSFVFLTDNELTHRHNFGLERSEYVKFSEGADLLIHDAEFTPQEYEHTKGWGHSVYQDALDMAIEAGVKELGLFHHNQDRTDQAIDAINEDCNRIIKEKKVELLCTAIATGTEIKL
ncbi:Metal-dependent hydrolases of the beta-lactamase superfamily I [hydrothermal vent metagenome]|uniref:Metal-dependent hydrolases of the beta-lactamase superfamily I n=1 Tax=hydrothermal vent metagenome TaxID=652676 RepID=A0A3B0R9M9_9ZZZZ